MVGTSVDSDNYLHDLNLFSWWEYQQYLTLDDIQEALILPRFALKLSQVLDLCQADFRENMTKATGLVPQICLTFTVHVRGCDQSV